MSDVERLTAELALAKLSDQLEAAREDLHKDRTSQKAKAKYDDLSNKVAAARREYREKHRDAEVSA